MPKSRNRKKKKRTHKRRPKPYEVVKQEFVRFKNPIPPDIPFEDRMKFLLDYGNKAQIEFEKAYIQLTKYFEEYDPLYICSFCSYYFVRQEEGLDEEAINGAIDFPPFYLEVIQCLSLMREQTITAKPLYDKVEDLKANIKNLNQNLSYSYLRLIEKAKNQDDIGSILLRTEMMIHTLAVRNWAYIEQMESIAYELADLVKEKFIKVVGFEPNIFLKILFGLTELTEKKLNIHLHKTLPFIRAKTYNEVFDCYEHEFSHVDKTDFKKREEIWNMAGKKIENLKALFMQHSDLFLQNIFTHRIDEIYEFFNNAITKDDISKVLDKLSLSFGDLSDINKDFIFLDNPVHKKPFIKTNSEEYYSVIPHMFFHLGVDLFENFIIEDNNLKNEYLSKKGKYLESKVENLFKNSFPKGRIIKGSMWKCPIENKTFENDITILIEDFAIIIECKSGTISPPAKRGAPDRLFKTMKELVVEPSEQAIRFQEYLKANPRLHNLETKSGIKNKIDSSKIKYFVPLGVTLSNLGSIGCNLKKLIDAKIITHKLDQLAPSISFSDLEYIFEILTLQSEKIHYLSRRREFEAHLNFNGDEMDLFGFYLDNGFNIGETEFDELNHIDLTLKSKELDPYFIGRKRGVDVKKPILQKTKYWNDLLTKIEKDSKNWLTASYILLNLPKEDQIKFEKNLKKLFEAVLDGKVKKKHNYMILSFGPERRKYILAGYPYKNTDIETRNNVINDIIEMYDKDESVRGILVLGYNLLADNYPYTVIAGSLRNDFFDELEIN